MSNRVWTKAEIELDRHIPDIAWDIVASGIKNEVFLLPHGFGILKTQYGQTIITRTEEAHRMKPATRKYVTHLHRMLFNRLSSRDLNYGS